MHTSTVTVAVIDTQQQTTSSINDNECKIEWYSGTGAGGQHRNKHQNSCRITHLPTGIVVTAQCRSRQNSLAEAVAELQRRVDQIAQNNYNTVIAQNRKCQVGTGMRGDKIRTYRFQDDRVQDHVTNKTASTKRVLAGHIDLLWK